MKRLSIVLLALAFVILAPAKTVKVDVEYVYQIPDNVSKEQAKATALERAKLQAIADEFGSVVTQSNSTNMSISNGEISSSFMSLGGSELKGEWIETIGEPAYEFLSQGDAIAVKVRVKGRIRDVNSQRVPVSVKTLRNGVDQCNESCDFQCGDALYMSFQAAANGFLAIYLIDANNDVFCLLPYQNQTSGIFDVKSNRKHLLFHKGYANDLPADVIDEFVMDTEQEKEHNRIVAVFSPNKFFKAMDSKDCEELPRNLSFKDFEKWLSGVKKKDVDLVISETVITICK